MTAPREHIIAGNWKMYKTLPEAEAFFTQLVPLVKDAVAEVFLAVPFTLISKAKEITTGSKIVIGAQNMNDASEGAFTGEIAGRMLKDAGAAFVLLGHSERRRFFNETDALVNLKVKRAFQCDIRPIVCIGESLEQREARQAFQTLEEQLKGCLEGLTDEQMTRVVIAYEPVWAIGTGESATPTLAQEAHHIIRQCIAKQWNEPLSQHTPILYGGSG